MQTFYYFKETIHVLILVEMFMYYIPVSPFHLWKTDLKMMNHNYPESSLSLKCSNPASFPLGYS